MKLDYFDNIGYILIVKSSKDVKERTLFIDSKLIDSLNINP